ncbi:MAG TPA: protease inhibitor I9 family protein, partial [Thermoanaerobaculia bacterium]|nr:protease inhibitor I9 family protein [Thermoanaerobaculia bacterium]
MNRRLIIRFILACLISLGAAAAELPNAVVGRYVVSLGESALADDPDAVAASLAAAYGGRLEPFAREGFRGFLIVLSPAKARLLRSDPRVIAVEEQGRTEIASAPAIVAAPRLVPVTTSVPGRTTTSYAATFGQYDYDGSGNLR